MEYESITSNTEKDNDKLSTIYELASNLEDTSTIVDPSIQFDHKVSWNSLKVKTSNVYRKKSLEK